MEGFFSPILHGHNIEGSFVYKEQFGHWKKTHNIVTMSLYISIKEVLISPVGVTEVIGFPLSITELFTSEVNALDTIYTRGGYKERIRIIKHIHLYPNSDVGTCRGYSRFSLEDGSIQLWEIDFKSTETTDSNTGNIYLPVGPSDIVIEACGTCVIK